MPCVCKSPSLTCSRFICKSVGSMNKSDHLGVMLTKDTQVMNDELVESTRNKKKVMGSRAGSSLMLDLGSI